MNNEIHIFFDDLKKILNDLTEYTQALETVLGFEFRATPYNLSKIGDALRQKIEEFDTLET